MFLESSQTCPLRPTHAILARHTAQVNLPTNFKAARFQGDAPTALLRGLESDIQDARYSLDGQTLEIPVKLKVSDSLFVPLAKWPMLIAGNYSCIRADEVVPIEVAVHGDPEKSKGVYQWVVDLCIKLGAGPEDLVPFDKYAAAASALKKPSSAARSLFGGAANIERVDKLVHCIAGQVGVKNAHVEEIVGLVDARLSANRAVVAAAVAAKGAQE